MAKGITGDNVTIEVLETRNHYDETILRSVYDGTFDRTNLPDELLLTDYIKVRDGQIVSLLSSTTSRLPTSSSWPHTHRRITK
jgi:hypothetical protein